MSKDRVRDGFVFYHTAWEAVENLRNMGATDMADKLLNAIIQYGFYGEYDKTDPLLCATMPSIIFGIEGAAQRRQEAIANGKKGGAKKKFDDNKIVELKLQGKTNAEVAEIMCCDPRTVTRAMTKYREGKLEPATNEEFVF